MLCSFYLLGPRSTDSKSAVLTNCTITPGTVSTWTVRVECTKKVVYIFLARVEGRSRIPPSSVHRRKTSFTQHRSPTSHGRLTRAAHGRLTRAAHTLPLCCFSSGLIDDALPTYRPTYLPVVCACSCRKNTPLSTMEYIHTGLETGDTSPSLCRWCSLQPCILHHHTSTTCPMIHADRGGT